MVGRSRAVRRVLLVTLFANLSLGVAKLAFGYSSGVLAVIADGYHSLLDGLSNLVALLGLGLGSRPPDEDHLYGHQKYEILSAMGISLLLFLAATEVIRGAVSGIGEDFSGATEAVASPLGFWLLLIALLVDIVVYRWQRRRGRELASVLLLADSEHTRSDIFSTSGAFLSLGAVSLGIPWVDVIIALLIGIAIARAAYLIIATSVGILTDRTPVDVGRIEGVARSFPDVLDVHQIRARGAGDQIFIDLSMHVDPEKSVRAAHDLAHEVENSIKEKISGVCDVVVHVEPEGEH